MAEERPRRASRTAARSPTGTTRAGTPATLGNDASTRRLLDGPLQRARRRRAQRPRQPPLRALHAADARPAAPDTANGDPPVHRQHRRRVPRHAADDARRHRPRCAGRRLHSFGVLRLTLHPTSYDWQFVPEARGGLHRLRHRHVPLRNASRGARAPSLSADRGRQRRRTCSWTAPASDGGAPITGYNVYRGDLERRDPAQDASATSPPTTTSAPSNGTKYYYRVAAINSVGEGAKSTEVSATPARGAASPTRRSWTTSRAAPDRSAASWQSPGLADAGTVSVAGAADGRRAAPARARRRGRPGPSRPTRRPI